MTRKLKDYKDYLPNSEDDSTETESESESEVSQTESEVSKTESELSDEYHKSRDEMILLKEKHAILELKSKTFNDIMKLLNEEHASTINSNLEKKKNLFNQLKIIEKDINTHKSHKLSTNAINILKKIVEKYVNIQKVNKEHDKKKKEFDKKVKQNITEKNEISKEHNIIHSSTNKLYTQI